MIKEDLQTIFESFDHPILLPDGFEDAFLGISMRAGENCCAAYDYGKCIEILVQRDGMSVEEAIEYLDYNTLGYIGEGSPVFVDRTEFEIPSENKGFFGSMIKIARRMIS